MDIIFDYQPVELTTRFTVNGVVRSDLFGELGAVSGYPLQSWLWRRGPWMGLEKVLQDVARNRRMEVTFIGREMDFLDFERAVCGMERIGLHFQPAYESTSASRLQADKLSGYIETHPDMCVREAYEQLLAAKPTKQWRLVETVEQYQEEESRIRSGRLVILLAATVFRAVKRELVEMLRENFMRPGESIVVLAESPQEKMVLKEELENMGISVAEQGEDIIEHLIEKYSVPEIISENIKIYRGLASLLASLPRRYEEAREENRKTRLRLYQESAMDEEAERPDGRYKANLDEIRWFEAHRQEIKDDLARLGEVTGSR